MSERESLLDAPSPRPWYFDGRDIFSTGPTDDTGGHRLVVPLPNTFHPSQRVSDADAAFIVLAVNAYDRMEAALYALLREFEMRGPLGASPEDVAMYLRMAKEALDG